VRIIIALALLLSLGGCAEFGAFKSGVATHGADASDQTLEANLWYLCNASSVGSIKRRFKTVEEVAAYNVICPGVLPGS